MTATFGFNPNEQYKNSCSPLYGDDTSRDAQVNKGQRERELYGSNAPQQAHESYDAYLQRINGY